MKKIVWSKIFIIILIIVIITWFGYFITNSLWSLVIPFLLLIISVIWDFFKTWLFRGDFANYIDTYAEKVNYEEPDSICDYMFFRDEIAAPIHIIVNDKGIYIKRILICSAVIPWKNIKTLTFFEHKGNFLARLHVVNGENSDRTLCLPWIKKFDKKIPFEVMIVSNESGR